MAQWSRAVRLFVCCRNKKFQVATSTADSQATTATLIAELQEDPEASDFHR